MSRHRRSIRLKGFDYAGDGAYFVTVCANNRVCLFGHIMNEEMNLSLKGVVAFKCLQEIPNHFDNVTLDIFVVMPNHVHAIIFVDPPDNVGARYIAPLHTSRFGPLPKQSLATIVGNYKAAVTRRIRQQAGEIIPIWQRNYHERIIRSDKELNEIRGYVATNPARWMNDSLYIQE